MKKFLVIAFLIATLFPFPANAAKVDNTEINSLVKDGHTMVPLSSLSELLDLTYEVNSGTFSVSDGIDPLSFTPGSDEAFISSAIGSENMPVSALAIDGEIYVPFRFVCEYYGARVYWTAEKGAFAERKSYGVPTLIRANENIREVLDKSGEIEYATVYKDKLIFVSGDSTYISDKDGENKKYLCSAGKAHVSGDKLFVMGQGNLSLLDLVTFEEKLLIDGVIMVGYTYDDYAWCEISGGAVYIFDNSGEKITTVTAVFSNPFDYHDGFVYYTDSGYELRRARPDGSEDEFLAKAAFYPVMHDGFIYYSDLAENYRRIDPETKEDIMVYGLNLELIETLNDKLLLNYYATEKGGTSRMFITDGDGTDFSSYGSAGLCAMHGAKIFDNRLYFISLSDNKPYISDKNESIRLSDDITSEFCGVIDGYIYYIVR